MATVSREASAASLSNAGSIHSEGDGEPASTDKEDSPEFKGSMSPASFGSSHISPFQLLGSSSFSINALTLTLDILQDFVTQKTCTTIFWVWFSAMCPVVTGSNFPPSAKTWKLLGH